MAIKRYASELLQTKKIRPSRPHYGASLLFGKREGMLRGAVDYRALNQITKPNNAPILHSDDMFNRLEEA